MQTIFINEIDMCTEKSIEEYVGSDYYVIIKRLALGSHRGVKSKFESIWDNVLREAIPLLSEYGHNTSSLFKRLYLLDMVRKHFPDMHIDGSEQLAEIALRDINDVKVGFTFSMRSPDGSIETWKVKRLVIEKNVLNDLGLFAEYESESGYVLRKDLDY